METVVRLAQHAKRVALRVTGFSRFYVLHFTGRCGSVPTSKDIRSATALLTSIPLHSLGAFVSRQSWIQVAPYRISIVSSPVAALADGFSWGQRYLTFARVFDNAILLLIFILPATTADNYNVRVKIFKTSRLMLSTLRLSE